MTYRLLTVMNDDGGIGKNIRSCYRYKSINWERLSVGEYVVVYHDSDAWDKIKSSAGSFNAKNNNRIFLDAQSYDIASMFHYGTVTRTA